uniref:LPXTG cell wall anchor domain-containing protein n=1 Tax=Stomatobaculum longum TaxID=796942 RepID=UPI002803754B
GGGGAGGGGGTRNGGHRATISPNNVAPLPANNAKPSKPTVDNKPVMSEPTSDNKPAMSEPTPQKNADRQGDSKLADKNGGKKPSAAQGNVLQGRKRRLPKTGEAPLALNYAGLALGMLLAGFAVAKKKEER